MPVNVIAIDLGMNFRDVEIRILCALASLDDNRTGHKLDSIGMGREIAFDLGCKLRLSLSEGLIHDYQHFCRCCSFRTTQNVPQDWIRGAKDVFREMDLQMIADLNGTFNPRHSLNVEHWTQYFENY